MERERVRERKTEREIDMIHVYVCIATARTIHNGLELWSSFRESTLL